MKYLTVILLLAITSFAAIAQQSSPYVETATAIVNNSGFKSVSIRATPLTRPTPMHGQNDVLNSTFPTRFDVAKADALLSGLTGMTWADANGWTNGSNSSLTSAVASIIPTGCNAYFELGTLAGSWRLPTQREMILIALTRNELNTQAAGFVQLSGTYWTSTQNSATGAWSFDYSIASMYVRTKTTLYKVRCVRDL